jgi:hypothetical protein
MQGYNVFVDGSIAGTVNAPTVTLDLTGYAPGSTHSVQVQAFDVAGNRSALSGAVSVTVPTVAASGDTFPGLAITGARGETLIDTTGATSQSGEPPFVADSIWATWTAPSTGLYTFDTLLNQRIDTYASILLGLNPAGYWRLNEGGAVAVDDGPGQNHGVYVSPRSAQVTGPNTGQYATQFNSSSPVTIPSMPGLSYDGALGFTIAAVARTDSAGPEGVIASKAGEWELGWDAGGYYFEVPGIPRTAYRGGVTTGEWDLVIAILTTQPPACTLELNVNASVRQSTPCPNPPPASLTGVTVGSEGSETVCDFACWNRVLSPDEIGALYVEFAGIQNPPQWLGTVATGQATLVANSIVMTFTDSVPAGDTILVMIASEYAAGGMTIFDTKVNDWHRLVKAVSNPDQSLKLACYRCDVTTPIAPGDTLTVQPNNEQGVKCATAEHYEPLGAFDSPGFASEYGAGFQPPGVAHLHPSNRNVRVIGSIADAGPPGDGITDDPDYSSAGRIGTVPFDAGPWVLRGARIASGADNTPGTALITLPVTRPISGGVLELAVATQFTPTGGAPVATIPGATFTQIRTFPSPDNVVRLTVWRATLSTPIASGTLISVTPANPVGCWAALAYNLTGAGTIEDEGHSGGLPSDAHMGGATMDPTSLAGDLVCYLAIAGPLADGTTTDAGFGELDRVGSNGGAANCTLQAAAPLKRISHEVRYNPPAVGGGRSYATCGISTLPTAGSGGPLTPEDTCATINVANLNFLPVGADVAYTPTLGQGRVWISLILGFLA